MCSRGGESGQTLSSPVGTKTATSQQIGGARSSRSAHPNPRVEMHLFSNSSKSLDIVGLHHKNSRYIGSAKLQEILIMSIRNKGAKVQAKRHMASW